MQTGTLYIVSTPIGDPEDISFRALRILGQVTLIVCEDARITRPLLDFHTIRSDTVAFTGRSDIDPIAVAIAVLLGGQDVALVSDVGTPLIADPGISLVRRAVEAGIVVSAVPGPSALVGALTVSGISAQRFLFDGFPPRAQSDRIAFFSALKSECRTIVLFETRQHLHRTLLDLIDSLGENREICIVRDLTRQTETITRGRLRDVEIRFSRNIARGEYAVVISGAVETKIH